MGSNTCISKRSLKILNMLKALGYTYKISNGVEFLFDKLMENKEFSSDFNKKVEKI